MKSTDRVCHICGGADFEVATIHYGRCIGCGHETLSTDYDCVQIINDRLDRDNLEKRNALDRFKTSVLSRSVRSKSFLLDVGSASGRFLFQHRKDFEQVMGVEITPECIRFSRELGLHIVTNLDALEDKLSVVTFWHSLEHIPAGAQGKLLEVIRAHSMDKTVLVVSVPNADSMQYRLLKSHFAFYDVPAHLHQFSVTSLDKLMARHGFDFEVSCVSLTYSAFGWLQGLLNLFNTRHNYYYYRTKRGWNFGLPLTKRILQDAYNLFLMGILAVPVVLFTILDVSFPRFGGVVTRCYHVKTH